MAAVCQALIGGDIRHRDCSLLDYVGQQVKGL
jgi:hypothetical protein